MTDSRGKRQDVSTFGQPWLGSPVQASLDMVSPPPPKQPLLLDDLSRPPSTDATTDVGRLFQRLPTEIRRQILITAFGGRVIHIDLSLVHGTWKEEEEQKVGAAKSNTPLSKLRVQFRRLRGAIAQADQQSPANDRTARDLVRERIASAKDAAFLPTPVRMPVGWDSQGRRSRGPAGGSNRWQRLSRVCRHQDLNTLRYGMADFALRECRLSCCYTPGISTQSDDKWDGHCEHGRDLSEETCHEPIGISGWLRTCKQAYLEGMDVLYETNTFQLSGAIVKPLDQFVLLRHPTAWLPAERLRRVKLTWSPTRGVLKRLQTEAEAGVGPHPQQDADNSTAFQNFLDQIPRSLPNLKALYLCVFNVYYDTSEPWDTNRNFQRSQQAETDVFRPVDAMFRRLRKQRLHEFYLGVPSSIFTHRFEAGGPKGLWLEPAQQRLLAEGKAQLSNMVTRNVYRRQRVWRRLPVVSLAAGDRHSETAGEDDASKKGKQKEEEGEGEAGYWINKSCDDFFVVPYCFGSGPSIDWSQYPHPYKLDPH